MIEPVTQLFKNVYYSMKDKRYNMEIHENISDKIISIIVHSNKINDPYLKLISKQFNHLSPKISDNEIENCFVDVLESKGILNTIGYINIPTIDDTNTDERAILTDTFVSRYAVLKCKEPTIRNSKRMIIIISGNDIKIGLGDSVQPFSMNRIFSEQPELLIEKEDIVAELI